MGHHADDDFTPPPGLEGDALDMWFTLTVDDAATRFELEGLALNNVNLAALSGEAGAVDLLQTNGWPWPPIGRP